MAVAQNFSIEVSSVLSLKEAAFQMSIDCSGLRLCRGGTPVAPALTEQ
jgi:hypothetical protein